MAKPPEVIEDVLPSAEGAVVAEVLRVVQQSPQQKYPQTEQTSLPTTAAKQVVELKVTKVLFGGLATAGASVQAVKPEGAYALTAGNKGPFVLAKGKDGIEILGRYGPDTWPENVVSSAAKKLGKS
jgi:hypothetical protein